MRIPRSLPSLFLLLLALSLLIAACAPASESDRGLFSQSDDGAFFGDTAESAAMATGSSTRPEAQTDTATSSGFSGSDFDTSAPSSGPADASEAPEASPTQQRLIVRTIDMTLEIGDVFQTMDDISTLAVGEGGWVVSSNRSAKHRGFISIRVPAEKVDSVVRSLRNMAIDVTSENATSQDVTDDYFDIQARITNLEATEVQLREILALPGEIEDILAVQRELTKIREEIEVLEGRKRFLEETSSTALISVSLDLTSGTIEVDAGADQIAVENNVVSFRATFTPPEDITEFTFQWDFGDGTPIVIGNRTAPSVDGTSRTTATVTHVYWDKDDSPFIVTFEITGVGEGGIADGEDTAVITVESVPNIQVEAGGSQTVTVNEMVTLEASLTRPAELPTLTYRWDFGDGLEAATGTLSEGETTISVEHVYSLDRVAPYTANLTVEGQTNYGAVVKASESVRIFVVPDSPWVVGVWDLGETTKAGVRALSAVAQTGFAALIWLLIFSPLWLAVALGSVFVVRRARRSRIGRSS